MINVAYTVLFCLPIVIGVSLLVLGLKRQNITAKILMVTCGFAAMTINPFINIIVFSPFAPNGYDEKMKDNKKYEGQSIEFLLSAKGKPKRIVSIDEEEHWYYEIQKPFFVIEFDELVFTVKNKKVIQAWIDHF